MKLKFTKMQGLGNDFIVIDQINQNIQLNQQQLRFLADRHFGIGCDQILMVENGNENVDFGYRIFNADGGEVEQCGNGARCFVRYVHDHGLTKKEEVRVETLSGVITLKLESDGAVTVNMGIPEFEPQKIPFIAQTSSPEYTLELQNKPVKISVLSIGNPHAVRIIDDIDQAPVTSEGAKIEAHQRFPNRVNVGYMQIISRKQIKLRVFERGAGETLACGTGACAAVVAGINLGLLDSVVTVNTHGGELIIQWSGPQTPVFMTGPAVTVFEGEINL